MGENLTLSINVLFRLPVVTWINPHNGKPLARSSMPRVSYTFISEISAQFKGLLSFRRLDWKVFGSHRLAG